MGQRVVWYDNDQIAVKHRSCLIKCEQNKFSHWFFILFQNSRVVSKKKQYSGYKRGQTLV